MAKIKFWKYCGRFVLTYIAVFAAVGFVFTNLQGILPETGRTALDFFEPFQFSFTEFFRQGIRAGLIALVLYPFYDKLMDGKKGTRLLFAAIWGLSLLGSLEPQPGSLEGVIYTETTMGEHLLVLVFVAIQVLIFSRLFLFWEKSALSVDTARKEEHKNIELSKMNRKSLIAYLGRFTLIHFVIYMLIGVVFMQLASYEEAFLEMEAFELYRPLDSIILPILVFAGQLIRGPLLALFILPFYDRIIKSKRGWLLLYGLLLGLLVVSPLWIRELYIPLNFTQLADLIGVLQVGLPEIIVQTLLISILFYKLERRKYLKNPGLSRA